MVDYDLWDFENDSSVSITSVNDTFDCMLQRAVVSSMEVSTVLDVTLRSLHAIYSIVLLACSSILNSFVIFLVLKHKALRSLSMVLAIQVIVVNLIGVVSLFPAAIANAAANRWLFGTLMCYLQGAVVFIVPFTRTGLMFVLVIDRFLLIYKTFSYPKYRTKLIISLSILTWSVVILLAAIMLPGVFNCYGFSRPQWICSTRSICSRSCSLIVLLSFAFALICCSVSAFLYTTLFCKAKKIKSLKHGPMFESTQGREWKATITFSLMFTTLFVVTVPVGLFLSIGHLVFRSESPVWFVVMQLFAIELIRLYYLLDPIFIMRNQDIKEVITNLLY